MYYRYNSDYILVEKSIVQLEGDNVVTYWEDLDLDLYKVTVMYISNNGEMLRHTKKMNGDEAMAKRFSTIEEQILKSDIEVDYRLSILELGLN